MHCVAIASGGDEAVRLARGHVPRRRGHRRPGGRRGHRHHQVAVRADTPACGSSCSRGGRPRPPPCGPRSRRARPGLLPKSSTLGVVCNAIPALIAGCFIADRRTVEFLCSSALPEFAAGRPAGPLTRRERDILVLLVRGVDLQNAAARLGITVNTARGYVKTLYRKLGVHNQLELVALARERGLLEPTD